jgi:hypothetical protein
MRDAQARLLAFPLVMIAGSVYAKVRGDHAPVLGVVFFIVGGIFFLSEWARSFRSHRDAGRRNAQM